MTIDVDATGLRPLDQRRSLYPALGDGHAYFDGPGGSQAPLPVIHAVTRALHEAMSNEHGAFAASRRSDATIEAARLAVADLVGADPRGVVLGSSMTAVTFRIADAFAQSWQPGDEIVVSRLDHDANVRPWVIHAERAGARVRWADVDPVTCELPVEQYDELIGDRTKLVAVTAASNAVGTRPDVRGIADRAHAAGAVVYVDGVHATPHGPVDMAELGADLYACSSYKFFGPHLGCVAADPALLETLRPAKLAPASDGVPERFEWGTPPFELYAGLDAAIDHLADLTDAQGTRRTRLLAAAHAIEAYCGELFAALLDGLRSMPGVTVYGAAARRTPTLAFRVDGWTARQVAEALGDERICVWSGNYYAYELMRRLDLDDTGGAVRIGLLHYNTAAEVDRALTAIERLTTRSPA